MGWSSITVAEVDGRKELARFAELPQALHGDDERFAPPVMAWERYRVDQRRNPYFERGEAGLFLARQGGRLVGRIAAHVPADGGEGRFGFWALVDDGDVAAALLEAARSWLAERGCAGMRGPLSFDDGDEPGVLVEGFHAPGRTGLPWHPPSDHHRLEAAGARRVATTPMWTIELDPASPRSTPAGERATPPQAAGYGDPALVLDGIEAVPDVAGALRSTDLRRAWRLARRARQRDWDEAVVVACTGDPSEQVPRLAVAAASAGYRRLVAPLAPDMDAPPAVVHARYQLQW
ncbi:MAG: hypothetical protein M3Z03_00905 [Actinomycetota bacterium]|nr:hypothetical protein [Actinomycetota bacterium]